MAPLESFLSGPDKLIADGARNSSDNPLNICAFIGNIDLNRASGSNDLIWPIGLLLCWNSVLTESGTEAHIDTHSASLFFHLLHS